MTDDLASALQAAPTTLRRCSLYEGANAESIYHSTPSVPEVPKLLIDRCIKVGPPGKAYDEMEVGSAKELLDAVRTYATACDVSVSLGADGGCVVFDRP